MVGTFDASELVGKPGDEYGWGMAPHVERRMRRMLDTVDSVIQHHRRMAARCEEAFAAEPSVTVHTPTEGRCPVYLQYPLLSCAKGQVLARARRKRVALSDIFRTPVHPLAAEDAQMVGYRKGACRVAEQLCETVVSIPLNTRVNAAELQRAIGFVEESRDYFV